MATKFKQHLFDSGVRLEFMIRIRILYSDFKDMTWVQFLIILTLAVSHGLGWLLSPPWQVQMFQPLQTPNDNNDQQKATSVWLSAWWQFQFNGGSIKTIWFESFNNN